MMATPIPSPLPISCTDCHQPMRVEFQMDCWLSDMVLVAAECGCGRVIGEVPRRAVAQLERGRPLMRFDIQVRPDVDPGTDAADTIRRSREVIADMERVIAAATWAREGAKRRT